MVLCEINHRERTKINNTGTEIFVLISIIKAMSSCMLHFETRQPGQVQFEFLASQSGDLEIGALPTNHSALFCEPPVCAHNHRCNPKTSPVLFQTLWVIGLDYVRYPGDLTGQHFFRGCHFMALKADLISLKHKQRSLPLSHRPLRLILSYVPSKSRWYLATTKFKPVSFREKLSDRWIRKSVSFYKI